jgi:uncharacterized protein (DUF1499 family)
VIALAIALVVAAGLALALRSYMDRDAENRLRADEDITLAGFAGPVPGNGALACPPGYCGAAGVILSPVFAIGVDRLIAGWREVLGGEPRLTRLARHDDGRREVVLQRSAMLHFPDVITVEFVSLGPHRSSLAIYSRARYGRSDFGVNKARIERWLARLETVAGAAQ